MAILCSNYKLRANLSTRTVCRFAVAREMPQTFGVGCFIDFGAVGEREERMCAPLFASKNESRAAVSCPLLLLGSMRQEEHEEEQKRDDPCACLDFLDLAGAGLDNHVRNQTEGDAEGNVVGEGHHGHCQEGG